MASETPGGQRRRIAWKDDRSTNKIYASNDRSAVQGGITAADSTLKPGQEPAPGPPNRARAANHGLRSTDEYYKAQNVAPTAQQVARKLPTEAPRLGQPRSQAQTQPPGTGQLLVREPAEVNGVLQEVVNRLCAGEATVVLYVKTGDTNLLRRVRAALEILVTREVITEDQYRDIRLSYEPSHAEQQAINAKLGSAPAPRGNETRSADNEAIADPLAFLRGEIDDPDNFPPVEAAPVTAVDTSLDEQLSPAPSYPTAPVGSWDDDGADNSFLTPPMPPPNSPQQLRNTHDELDRQVQTNAPIQAMDGIGEVPEGAPPSEHITTPTEELPGIGSDAPKPRTKGRRSGRGSQ